jgi:hypothetical protein
MAAALLFTVPRMGIPLSEATLRLLDGKNYAVLPR